MAGGIIAGRYKLIEEIGEGGMGTVWMAQQTEPVKRAVAVKLIKQGMDSKQVLARFEAERQALALMDHPNIARVLDGGATESGRPYFVMELVKGMPITKYCDEHRLTPKQRLELFVPVCQAVQHAHQKGIIHRDIKPSNVLVAQYDGRPVPKVIDFGVAKAAGQQLTDKTLMTGFGAVVGTLEYMSPEQAELNQLDIDTRSDIYSLGVVLYELLTGSTPLDRKRLKQAAFAEALRIIREEEPPKPSTRLSGSKDSLPSISAQRHMEPAKLTKLVRGELDWIVMKALDKDRNRRYETANGFAMDVQRYLADEVVEARPPSAAYRLTKFIRRNPLPLALAGLVALLLLGGAAFAWYTDQQASARRTSEARLEGERAAEARHKEQQARQGVDANLKLATELRRQYRFAAAAAALAQAVELARGGAPDRLAEVEQARRDLAFVVRLDDIRYRKWIWIAEEGGRGRFNEPSAAPEYRQAFVERGLDLTALDPAEAAQRLGASAVKAELVPAVDDWALWEPEPGLRRRLLDIARRADGGPWLDRLRDPAVRNDRGAVEKLAADADPERTPVAALSVLAELMKRQGLNAAPLLTAARTAHPADFELAFCLSQLQDRSEDGQEIGPLEAARALRPENYAVWINLGHALWVKGQLDEAIACFQKAIALDPKYAIAHTNLGNALCGKGQLDEAIACYHKAIALDPKDATPHYNLGTALKAKGQLDEAIACFQKVIALDPKYAQAHNNLGNALKAKGQVEEAIACFQKAIALKPKLAPAHTNLGHALFDKGQLDEAIACFQKAIALDPKGATAHYNLGNALCGKGQLDEAIACWRTAIVLDPKYAAAHCNLGAALHGKGKVDEAITCYRKAIALDPKLAQAHNNLGNALKAKGQLDEAIACYHKAIALDPKYAKAHNNLGVALIAKGQLDEAIACYHKAIALDPMDAQAHGALGQALLQQGRYAEAKDASARALALLPEKHPLRARVSRQVQDCERLLKLEERLPRLLRGEDQAGSARECLDLMRMCQAKRLHAAAARFAAEAFAADPKLASNPPPGLRYNAACSAALAAAGQGEDAAKLEDAARAKLRGQALDWLKADVSAWGQLLDSGPPQARATLVRTLSNWQKDADLAGLRDAAALARLPADEQKAFAQLWADVAALRKKAEENSK
jgi:tetratricopeptide (TPR) repeat protein